MLSAFTLFGLLGCRKPAGSPVRQTAQGYHLRGTVVSVSAPDQKPAEIVLKHEAIPGLMGAMTMPYPVDEAIRGEVHAGDRLTAEVQVDREGGSVAVTGLTDVVIVDRARPDTKPAVQYHVPIAGEAVPDFFLRNQSGQQVRLSQFRGRVLLLTFIYTRCPLADFCPRMSRNFAEVDKALSSDPVLYRQTHLLSASFDPAYDTPAVLRSYGSAYTGRYTRETFEHWDFAAPTEAELPKIEQWFDLGVTIGPKGTFQHSVATVVIGKDGRIVSFYPTNDWSVEQALAQVKKAAAA